MIAVSTFDSIKWSFLISVIPMTIAFSRMWLLNHQNCHYLYGSNPKIYQEVQTQQSQKLNVQSLPSLIFCEDA